MFNLRNKVDYQSDFRSLKQHGAIRRCMMQRNPELKAGHVEALVEITSTTDIVNARHEGRVFAQQLGFAESEVTMITTAISEVARSIADHARRGQIVLTELQNGSRHGIKIVAREEVSRMPRSQRLRKRQYSRPRGDSDELSGAKMLMDEFKIESRMGNATVVTMKKWSGNFSCRAPANSPLLPMFSPTEFAK